jgi:16S rRNA (cytosine967-C5)-methyltransferase
VTAPPGLAARRAAAALVAGVLDAGCSLADQMGAGGPLRALTPAERARAQTLAAGILRHLGRIDGVLANFLHRRPPSPALNALRLAVAEIHVDGVPPHAAVDGAVRLARAATRGRQLPGLVNAVARRVADAGPALWQAAAEAALPGWLAGPVGEAYGPETAAGIAAAHLRGAPLDLTPRDPDEAPALARALAAELLPTGSLRLSGRPQVSALPGFDEGRWWVQDAAAAMPARLAGPVAGLRVLDLCAAPGGKTLQFASAGAAVTALDASEARLARLRENLGRTRLTAEIVTADALTWEAPAAYDVVMLDAPCSATGTIRRHPDLPYLRSGRELGPLIGLQADLLRRTWSWVLPGGRLVYAVCSLLPAEGEAQLARFLAEMPDASVAPPDPAALGIESGWVDAAGGLRLRPDYWPERGGMDGFYAVCLRRRRA